MMNILNKVLLTGCFVLINAISSAQASDISLVPLVDNAFVSGQFICKEINEYGDMIYACGGRTQDGSVRGLASHNIIPLSDSFLLPYHDPTKLKILSVSIVGFNGEIQTDAGEQVFACQFPQDTLIEHTQALIEVTTAGECVVRNLAS